MECEEIIKLPVAIEILQKPEKKHLQANLFNCIYSLFQSSFLTWVFRKYSYNKNKQRLWEDAKDAFQNGLSTFYIKSQQKGFTLKSSLKTTIYSYGMLQLLAFFKKGKQVYDLEDYSKWFELFFDDEFLEKERQNFVDDREQCLIEALATLPNKQRDILCMKFFKKLKSKEIAEILRVTPGNVDNESAKAYKALREILKLKFNFKKQEQWN